MISEILSRGQENAITSRDLARILKKTQREITAQVQKERREGAPICATARGRRKGYFLAANKEEMQDFIGRLHHRAGEIYKTRRALQKTIDSLPSEENSEGKHQWRLKQTTKQ